MKASKNMRKLANMLDSFSVPYEITKDDLGYMEIFYPCKANPIRDVICDKYCWAYEKGLLETMKYPYSWKNLDGYLTATDVFFLIFDDYRSKL